jgi:hypothetical protein
MTEDRSHGLRALIAALALCLLPTTAWSVQLFEGNIGWNGDWLHVQDSTALGHRVYWYDLGTDVTYRFELATDEGFSNVVLDIRGIDANYVETDVVAGFYFFRVSAIDFTGAVVSSSDIGTLDVLRDWESPTARVLPAPDGETCGSTPIQLEVSDDTVLNIARFTIDGDYVGTIGFTDDNYKLVPSLGEALIVSFDYPVSTGASISVEVSDVMGNRVTATGSCGSDGGTTTGTKGKGGGKGRGKKK